MFPGYSERLLSDTGIDNGYLRCGGIEFLADSESDYLARWKVERLAVEGLTAARLAELVPRLALPVGMTAHYLPEFAQVRNPWHLRALLAACRMWRCKIRSHARAIGFEFAAGKVDGVKLEGGEVVRADRYVIAAGAWAAPLLAALGVSVPVAPVRGQVVLFKPQDPVCQPVLLLGKRYLVPRGDGRVLVGSTEEPEAGFLAETTEAGLAELTEFARGVLPALVDAEVEASWAGLRPGSPDCRPTIGCVPGHPNVICAVGHFRAGIQQSLATAYLVRNLVFGEEPIVPLAPFAVGRPACVPEAGAFRS